jgi:DNA-binding transcriptional LysR family regulator
MDWEDIRYLLAIHRAENMVSAAQHLGVNQSTVSRRLQAIESALGERLFYRSGGSLVATDRMGSLLPEAEQMERGFFDLQTRMETLEESTRPVRVNAMPWVVNHLLLPALPKFLEGNPGISVETISSVRDRNRSIGESDLSLRFELMPKSKELCEPIAQVAYSVYARKGRTLPDLAWIGFGGDFDGFAPARWAQNRELNQVVRVNDAGAMLIALEQGLGLGLLPDLLGARSDLLQRATKKQRPELTRTLRLLVHQDLARRRDVAKVIDWLYEIMNVRGLKLPGSRLSRR